MAVPSMQAAAARTHRPELADIFRSYAKAYQATYAMSPAQQAVMRDIMQCRTAQLGGHLEACQSCGLTRPVYNSCRNRHCSKCQALDQAKWRATQQALLLPIPYFHIVFTLPHELTALLHANRRFLYGCLFQTAMDTLKQFARDPKHLAAELGVTAILHTWGQTLAEHVHLHCIVTGGGLSHDGKRWISSRTHRFLFPVRALGKMFRGKFLAQLTKAHDNDQLCSTPQSASLHNPLEWQRLLCRLRSKKWVVYAKPPVAGPEQVLNYLARYTHRIAISNERILEVKDGMVSFRYKDYNHANAIKVMTLPALEFIRRVLLHVLPPGFMRVRHYGLLANRQRADKLQRCRELLGSNPPPAQPSSKESLADRVRRLMGIDISRCPACGGGPMRVVATLAPVALDTS
jgi:hypothetical protein